MILNQIILGRLIININPWHTICAGDYCFSQFFSIFASKDAKVLTLGSKKEKVIFLLYFARLIVSL